MIKDAKRLVDGQLEFSGGVDTGRSPSRLNPNQVALSINNTHRGDFIQERPGFRQHKLTFDSPMTQGGFELGYFQKAKAFYPTGGDPILFMSMSGRIFNVNMITFNVTEVALPDPNPSDKAEAWMEQVEDQIVWQDGESVPLIIGTGSVIRSDVKGIGGVIDTHPKRQVPTGKQMAYVNGRLVVALPDGVSFVIGDIVGGPTGPTYFTENTFINEGGSFKVPTNLGQIRAIRGMPVLDTSLGQGPIQVATTEGMFTCNPPPDRTTWKDVTYPINTVSMMKNGFLSDTALSPVNGDLWGRSRDGVRSYYIARRDFGMWANIPQSHEVEKFLEEDYEPLLYKASSINWKNWLITTCLPQQDSAHGVYHLGAVALDFSPITSIVNREPPAWDGMWTGLNFMQFVTVIVAGEERNFIVVLSDDSKIELWEMDDKQSFDLKADGTKLRISRAIEFPRLGFSNRMELKLLDSFDLWVEELKGLVDFTLYYRPDAAEVWAPWQSWQECANDCPDTAQCVPPNIKPQYRSRMTAQRAPDFCDVGTGNPTTNGCEFQARLEMIGAGTVTEYRMVSQRIDEDLYGPCLPTTVTDCSTQTGCLPSNILKSVV